MLNDKKLIIFVPAYNAEKTIASVFDRFPALIIKRASEILVLDNNSKDNTYKAILKYKKNNKLRKLTLVKNKKNLGYGGSKKKAFQYAIDKHYDIFVVVHADGQYPPEKLMDLITPIEKNKADLVIGSRINELKGGMKLWKLLGNRALTKLENAVFGLNLHEFHSGFKAYNVNALRKINIKSFSDDHILSSETIIVFKLKNFKIKEVFIPAYYSKETSECSPQKSFKYGLEVLKLAYAFLFYKLGLYTNNKLFK